MSLATRVRLKTSVSACVFMLATAANADPQGQKIYTQGASPR